MPARSSSDNGASGELPEGRVPRYCPGGGAYGNIIARHTAEWSKPNQCPNSCANSDSKSYAPCPCVVASAPGVANVDCPSFRNSVSASRICPAKTAGGPEPTDASGALAVITLVNASTPVVNPMLDWLKQIVFRPSMLVPASFEQAFAVFTRLSGPITLG